MKYLAFVTILLLCATNTFAETTFEHFFKDSRNYTDVVVEEIRSVNRFVIYNFENKKEIIKMIGLKVPEVRRRKRVEVERDQHGFEVEPEVNPLKSVEDRAYDYVKEILEGQHVRLEFDKNKKDDDNNTLAYVFLLEKDVFVNRDILLRGFAQLQVRPPNTQYKKELRSAYQEARREMRGLQGQ